MIDGNARNKTLEKEKIYEKIQGGDNKTDYKFKQQLEKQILKN